MKKPVIVAMVFLMAGCVGKTNNPQNVDNKAIDCLPLASVSGDSTTVRYLDALPADYREDDEFGLILDYGDYAMEVGAWPMPDDDWLITWHWCAEEDGCIYRIDENGEGVEVVYVDPFEGQPYPVIHKPGLSFSTRNYGGETIHFYAGPDSDEILCSTDYKEIGLDVVSVDVKTRRLLVQSNPNDWCWGEPQDEYEAEYRHPFVELRGWIDENWVCGSTMTTCP